MEDFESCKILWLKTFFWPIVSPFSLQPFEPKRPSPSPLQMSRSNPHPQAAVSCSPVPYRFHWAGICVWDNGQAGPCMVSVHGGAWYRCMGVHGIGARCWLGRSGRGLLYGKALHDTAAPTFKNVCKMMSQLCVIAWAVFTKNYYTATIVNKQLHTNNPNKLSISDWVLMSPVYPIFHIVLTVNSWSQTCFRTIVCSLDIFNPEPCY